MTVLKKSVFVLVLFLVTGLIMRRLYLRYWDPRLSVTFFDVGQGDSALIQFPRGKTMLIDAGGGNEKWNYGQRELYLELARLGILSLDTAVLSHPDQDHIMGYFGLLAHVKFKEFWYSARLEKKKRDNPLLYRLIPEIEMRGGRLKKWKRGEVNFNGAIVEVITFDGKRSNDLSLILRVKYAGCRFLFTGDIEWATEEKLNHETTPVTVLKVAHHGSKTSSTREFLERARPRYAVISTGIRNSYGHPHPSVLERFRFNDTQVFPTDFHGFVSFRVSPMGDLQCQTSQGSCGIGHCSD